MVTTRVHADQGLFPEYNKIGWDSFFFHFSLGQIVHKRAKYSLYLEHKNEKTFYKVEVTNKYIHCNKISGKVRRR